MDSFPISSKSLEKFYHIDGDLLGQQYKEHLSGYEEWEDEEHADSWLIYPENIGPRLSIDETSPSNGELYTVVTNKDAKGKKGCLVAIISGVQSEKIIGILQKIPMRYRQKVVEITLDMANTMNLIVKRCFPNAERVIDRFHVQKLAYDAIQEMRISHRWDAINEETDAIQNARLALWFNEVNDSNFKSFNTISATIYSHYNEILSLNDICD